MYVLRLQTCIVRFLSLFSEGPMCMCKNFKLFCCAAYILNLIVPICLSCWPNLWCSGVISAEFRSFRKNSAKPDISRKYGSASRIFWKIRLRGLHPFTFSAQNTVRHKPGRSRVVDRKPFMCMRPHYKLYFLCSWPSPLTFFKIFFDFQIQPRSSSLSSIKTASMVRFSGLLL